MQSIPPTTADKQTQAQKRRGSRSRKLLGAKAKILIKASCNSFWNTMIITIEGIRPGPLHTFGDDDDGDGE